MMTDDRQLLRRYRDERSEEAFGELVHRHIDLVYSAALRVVGGDSHLAQDVTQMIFIDLARKAWSLPQGVLLAGWLYRHTCFTAAKAVRTERRRRIREQTATEMSTTHEPAGPDWEQLAPRLDEGLNQLSAADRDAIVLRFLQRQDLRTVGAALGVGEDAAQKRVSRALEKLRGVLSRRGVALTTTAMASLLAAQSVTAAPAGLVVSVTAASLTAGAAVGTGFSLTLMKVMAMTKLQMTVAGVVLVTAMATPWVLRQQSLDRMRGETARLRQENESLQSQAAQVAALLAENRRLSNLVAQAAQASLRQPDQMGELRRLRGRVTQLQAEAKTNGKPSDGVMDTLVNPAMEGMMKASFATTVDKTYAEFFAKAQLTPEQAAALKELIWNKESLNLDTFLSVLSGKADAAGLHETDEQNRTRKAAYEEQIKQLLGEDEYQRLQAFEKTKGERMMISSAENQMPAGAELSSEQRQRLLVAMTEERQNFHFTVDLTDHSSLGDPASLSEAGIKRYEEERDQLRQRYVARAGEILSPDQVKAFDQFLKSQQQIEVAAVVMGAKLFATKTGN